MSVVAKSQTRRFRPTFLSLAAANRFFSSPADHPTTAEYDEVVNAAGRSGDFDELSKLLSRRAKDGCYNTAKTFDFVTKEPIQSLCQALSAVERGHARKCAFDALVSRLCRIGRVDESLHAIDAMARGGCAPTAATFNPAIDAAWRVVDQMTRLGVAADAPTFVPILLAHCASGDAESAAAVTERMVESGSRPDSRTYDALVLCACKAGRVEGAVALVRRMENDGVTALLSTRLYVVDALLGLGYYDMAVRFVSVYAWKDTWIDQESFRCLANRFLKLQRPDMARLVLEEMKSRGFDIGGYSKLKDLLEKQS